MSYVQNGNTISNRALILSLFKRQDVTKTTLLRTVIVVSALFFWGVSGLFGELNIQTNCLKYIILSYVPKMITLSHNPRVPYAI